MLLDAYGEALADLVARLKGSIRTDRSAEFESMRDLVERIDEIRAWLEARGFYDPQRPLRDAIEAPARQW